tara:strand:- start:620 stop:1540 length:921 start_codon:yes stop_codon:yes gene_type:complete
LTLFKILSKKYNTFLYCPDSNNKILKSAINNKKINLIDYNKIINFQELFDLCILDDYQMNNTELAFFKSNSKKILIINEYISESKHADLIFNLTLPDIPERRHIRPILITDLKYSLIDSSYSEIAKIFTVKKKVKRIIVNFGLVDSKSMTLKIIRLIDNSDYLFTNFKFDVLISSLNKDLNQIKVISNSSQIDFKIHTDNFNTNTILKDSDLVIGSGGLSLLERLTVGVPSLTFSISENQKLLKRKIYKLNCTYFVAEESINNFISIINKVINDYELRERMSLLARKNFDGKGALRLVELIEKKLI